MKKNKLQNNNKKRQNKSIR